jgi:hypothetical protein
MGGSTHLSTHRHEDWKAIKAREEPFVVSVSEWVMYMIIDTGIGLYRDILYRDIHQSGISRCSSH